MRSHRIAAALLTAMGLLTAPTPSTAQGTVASPAAGAGPSAVARDEPVAQPPSAPAPLPATQQTAPPAQHTNAPPASVAGGAARFAVPQLSAAAALQPASGPQWLAVPRATGRLRSSQIGLVVNTADPYSVAVGAYYATRRHLSPAQVLKVQLPLRSALSPDEFEALRQRIAARFGGRIQALALAWAAPYAVDCNSITGALALGFDATLCSNSCAPSRASPYFNSASALPFTELRLRPSMLLAAPSVQQARALIDRGVAADGSLSLRGRPPVSAMFLTTDDAARRVRTVLYPPPGLQPGAGIDVRVEPADALKDAPRVLLAITGSVRLNLAPAIDWVPGALADHLTSVGGALNGQHDQSTVLEWIASGATASHGSVSEPCNHLQKFPHPQLLLLHYAQGSTAMEAYWKSVAWPQQALFVGEPLAAPFSR